MVQQPRSDRGAALVWVRPCRHAMAWPWHPFRDGWRCPRAVRAWNARIKSGHDDGERMASRPSPFCSAPFPPLGRRDGARERSGASARRQRGEACPNDPPSPTPFASETGTLSRHGERVAGATALRRCYGSVTKSPEIEQVAAGLPVVSSKKILMFGFFAEGIVKTTGCETMKKSVPPAERAVPVR